MDHRQSHIEPLFQGSAEAWSGVLPPNTIAQRLVADLAATISAFQALRGELRFEDEASSFEAALRDAKERS